MTKAIEARRELLATAIYLSDRYESECGPETDTDLAGSALEHAVATKEYLMAEEAQALLPIVQLSPDHPIAHDKESDYDHWIGFVCQKIDLAAGFEVDVKARGWKDGGPTKILADDARGDRIYEAVLTLRDEFRALEANGATHAPDCHGCGGVYTCNRCSRPFGWCVGSYDDTPALCDDCANLVQGDKP